MASRESIIDEKDALDEFNARLEGDKQEETTESPSKSIVSRKKINNNIEFDEASMRMERNLAKGQWITIPLEELPSNGRFYPDGTVIKIKSATVEEIKDYAQIDTSNAKDVVDKINNIIAKCSYMEVKGSKVSYKNILETDKWMLLFHIRCATFEDGLNVITVKVPRGVCQTPGCPGPGEIKLDLTMIGFKDHDEDSIIAKYYDEKKRAFVVNTKSYGQITLYMPTIGNIQLITNWMMNNTDKSWDSTIVSMIPFFMNPDHMYTDNNIWNMIVSTKGWDTKKFTLIYRLIEALDSEIGLSQDLNVVCSECGEEMKVPFGFRFDVKQLFVANLSDLLSELD